MMIKNFIQNTASLSNKFVIFTALLTAIILSSCLNPLEEPAATLTINLGGGAGKAALYPPDNDTLLRLSHKIELKGPSEERVIDLGPGELSARVTLAPGQWEISVNAYIGEELYAQGSTSVEVAAGENNPASIKMTRNDEGGYTITGVVITPGTDTLLKRGAAHSFSAEVSGEGNYPESVTWSVSGNKETGTVISQEGVLIIDAKEAPDTELTITAVSALASVSTSVVVKVSTLVHAQAPVLVNLLRDTPLSTRAGTTYPITVEAASNDGGTISYQWYSNTEAANSGGTPIPGAATASYNAPTTEEGSYYYYVVVTNTIEDNGDGGAKSASITSGTVTLVVDNRIHAQAPVINTQPQDADVDVEDVTHTLTVGAVSGDGGTISYQWYTSAEPLNGGWEEIPNAAASSYEAPIDTIGTFYYRVELTNTIEDNGDGGTKTASVTSRTATLDVAGLTIEIQSPPAKTLTPLLIYENDIPTTERETTFKVVISKLHSSEAPNAELDIDSVNGLNFSGYEAADGVVSSDGTTKVFTVTVNLTENPEFTSIANPITISGVTGADYQGNPVTTTVNITDGKAADRAIEVKKDNIALFNAYANAVNTPDGLAEGLALHYILIEDIPLPVSTMGESNWTRIGFDDSPFTGTFDGNGKTISNLTINDNDPLNFQGMFGAVRTDTTTGTVKNLNLQDVNINAPSSDYVGAIAGANFGGVISNCHIIGTSSVEGRSYVGGVVGNNVAGGIIENCSSTGAVTGSDDNVGGVVGNNYGTISYSSSSGNVTVDGRYVGGVAGNNDGGTIKYCFATGNIEGDTCVGGVAGGNTDATIQHSYYGGTKVTASLPSSPDPAPEVAGGVVGRLTSGTVEFCYATGTVELMTTAADSIGGIAGIATTVQNCVALNDALKLPTGVTNFGRVRGDSGSTEDDNNYGRSDMALTQGDTDVPSPWMNKGAGNKDGEDIGSANISDVEWWQAAGFSSDYWDLTDISGNKLPTLKGFPPEVTQNQVWQ